jgi:hypothetical protein
MIGNDDDPARARNALNGIGRKIQVQIERVTQGRERAAAVGALCAPTNGIEFGQPDATLYNSRY